ncbi:putative uncharacterized protein DDB_G0282499 isoform X2 [Leptopilina boulardi]|nr:putative uncharacterized protein DDB_G0282499 isoform X2 [Leptopilina boulardi]
MLPVKSQIYTKSLNNTPMRSSMKNNFSGPMKINYDNNREFLITKRSRNRLLKNKPQKQRHILYYPPPKTYHYPYADRFRNFYKNPGFYNYNYFNNYRENNNNNNNNNENPKKIIKESQFVNENEIQETRVNFQKPIKNENFFQNNENSLIKNKNSFKNTRNSLFNNEDSLKKNSHFKNFPSKNRNVFVKNGNFLLKNKKIIYPPVPKNFMEPPGHATSDYRTYKKPEKILINNELYKNHNFYKNHKMNDDNIVKNSDRTPYIRDHAPENVNQELEEENIAIEEENNNEEEDDKFTKTKNNVSGLSPDGDRVEFQIQGHEGPRTYLFGYDTGEGSNRQYRLEEKLKDGTVKGQYGYYDARGKLRKIKYVAKPWEGYQEQHHSSPESMESDEGKNE